MNNKILENIKIIDISEKGYCIGKTEDNKIVLVKNVVPGDIIDIQINKNKKKLLRGCLFKLKTLSKYRTDPLCKHFLICGGCQWMNMQYETQLNYKQEYLINNLIKISRIQNIREKTKRIIASPKIYFHRNKIEYSFSNERWLHKEEINNNKIIYDKKAVGFHLPGKWNKIIDIDKCFLQEDLSNDIRNFIKDYAKNNKLSFFNVKENKGLLRSLIIRNNTNREFMITIQFGDNLSYQITQLLLSIKNKFKKNVKTITYCINKKANNTINDLDIIVFSGKGYIFEYIENLKFKITPKSFFQTNIYQYKNLYKEIKNICNINKNDIIYDLYTGTGTIAQYISRKCKKVIGIDLIHESIKNAKESCKINNIKNCIFFCGDVKSMLNIDFINDNGRPNIIICDPPREGLNNHVIETILNILPDKIIYVSCNVSTQARDILLMNKKYVIIKIQPIDMFPHTTHLENIILLEKINN